MKIKNFPIAFFLFLFCSFPIFSQAALKNPATEKIQRLKTDILNEIKSLKPKNQIGHYLDLADVFRDIDAKEAAFWRDKSVKIALDPATDFRDQKEKIEIFLRLYYFTESKDEVSARKLLAVLTGLLQDEVKAKGSDEHSQDLISLAGNLLSRDEPLAFQMALLSLTGAKPAINWTAFEFFMALRKKNPALSEKFFERMLAVAQMNGDRDQIRELFLFSYSYEFKEPRPNLSPAQRTRLLEGVVPLIQKETEELSLKNRADCEAAVGFGLPYLSEFKSLLPNRAAIVEQALSVCQSASIENWRKPDFHRRQSRTAQDFLEYAKQIGDPQSKANNLYFAALTAKMEKNFPFCIEILDGIDAASREKIAGWANERVRAGVELIVERYRTGDYAGITQILDEAPPPLRPYLILETFEKPLFSIPKDNPLALDLLNRARAEFKRMNFSPPSETKRMSVVNPARFLKLAHYFYRYADRQQTLGVFDEFIEIQNQLHKQFAAEDKNGEKHAYYFYSSLPRNLFETEFERIYQNIERIEAAPVRLRFRIHFLWESLHSGGRFGIGVVKIN